MDIEDLKKKSFGLPGPGRGVGEAICDIARAGTEVTGRCQRTAI